MLVNDIILYYDARSKKHQIEQDYCVASSPPLTFRFHDPKDCLGIRNLNSMTLDFVSTSIKRQLRAIELRRVPGRSVRMVPYCMCCAVYFIYMSV